jgi:glycopeptide antibiotics resistance protein
MDSPGKARADALKNWFVLLIPLPFFGQRIIRYPGHDYQLRGLMLDILINLSLVTLILAILIRRTITRRRSDWIVMAGFAVYFIVLYAETVWITTYYISNYQYSGYSNPKLFAINLVPFRRLIDTFYQHPVPVYQIIGNLLMLAPFAFFSLYFRWTAKAKRTILYMSVLSLAIELFELLQAYIGSYFVMGSRRWFDIDDIILNTSGAVIGVGCYQIWKAVEGCLRTGSNESIKPTGCD